MVIAVLSILEIINCKTSVCLKEYVNLKLFIDHNIVVHTTTKLPETYIIIFLIFHVTMFPRIIPKEVVVYNQRLIVEL